MKGILYSLFVLFLFTELMASDDNSKKIRVACIGDSITFGSAVEDRVNNNYPLVLQGLIGDKYEVRNFGNPGRGIIKSSRRGSQPRAYIFMKEHEEALKFNPHIVICNLGINDIMDYPKRNEEFVPDYKELLNLYRALPTNPRIIVWQNLAPLMQGQKFYQSPHLKPLNESIGQAVSELNEVAKEHNKTAKKNRVKKMRYVLTLDMETPLNDPKYISNDKIHPNAAGAKRIAEVTADFLKEKRVIK